MLDSSPCSRYHSPNTFKNPELRGRDGNIPTGRLRESTDYRNRATCFGEVITHLIRLIYTTRMLNEDDETDGEIGKSSTSIPAFPSLPEFDKILSEDVPRQRRRSRSPKKVQKVASGSKSVHKVKKQRPLLPKPAETTTSSSTSHTPSIFSFESSDVFDISDVDFESQLTSISILHELSDIGEEFLDPVPGTSLEDVNVSSLVLETKQEEEPGPSSSFSRDVHSDIPLILDLASSSSEASIVLEPISDEAVKDFVYGDEQEERQESRQSSSGLSKKRPSDIPLTFDVSSSESEASPGFGRTSDEVVKVFVYGEDQEVKQAAVESEKSQSVLPLIKEELRTRIQLRRLISGDGDAEPDIRIPYQMTLDELKKRERKKEQNRKAALRSRQRQTNQEIEIIQRHTHQMIQNEELKKEKEDLKNERNRLIIQLKRHFSTGCRLPRCADDKQTEKNVPSEAGLDSPKDKETRSKTMTRLDLEMGSKQIPVM